MSENLLNLIRKLKELADRGEDGEKDNAANKLQMLLDKHGISIEDIEKDVVKERLIKISPNQLSFFRQVIASCFGIEKSIYQYKKEPKRKELIRIVLLTDSEFIEFSSKFEFYWKKYENDLKIFYRAFILKNDLGTKNSLREDKELTQEELDEINKIREMMQGLKKHNLYKQIENK